MTRRLRDIPLWRLVLMNIGIRCLELADRSVLVGDALVERIKTSWQVSR